MDQAIRDGKLLPRDRAVALISATADVEAFTRTVRALGTLEIFRRAGKADVVLRRSAPLWRPIEEVLADIRGIVRKMPRKLSPLELRAAKLLGFDPSQLEAGNRTTDDVARGLAAQFAIDAQAWSNRLRRVGSQSEAGTESLGVSAGQRVTAGEQRVGAICAATNYDETPRCAA